ncbi:F-box family protein [Rhynchospora pubera]|uniref:F-box family protein n=1 Tax=Rhynchospora pubera TaxID=906938 RepID=A0AAV8ETQ5_9POAL|nr:F-box family protein [Rhynchospora pubera]
MKRARDSRGEKDIISSLSDHLIHLIMSFLTAQEAVRTCILSKRWKNLWTTLPFLDFDLSKFEYEGEFYDSEPEFGEPEPQINKCMRFRDFVSTTLLLRQASELHTFRLSCREMSSSPMYNIFVRSCILYAVKHSPQVLNINFSIDCPLSLGIFTCGSLVDVSLYCRTSVHKIKAIKLPCLRRLYLKETYINQDFIDKLFSGSPVLEFLHLENCGTEFSTLNSQSLKYLEIQCYCWVDTTDKRMELINTPNLLSFCYSICPYAMGHNMHLQMQNLTSASINSYLPYNFRSNILIGVSNVQNLNLSGEEIKALLENELSNCPEFSNLKDLSVDGLCLICHSNLLAYFLNHCPNLEELSLHHRDCFSPEKVHGNVELLKITPFKGKRLEKVEVKFVGAGKNFTRVVKYLQDITEESGAQINVTSLYDSYRGMDILEQDWQHV